MQILEARHMTGGARCMVFNAGCMQAIVYAAYVSLSIGAHTLVHIRTWSYWYAAEALARHCEPDSCSTTCSTQCTGSAETCGCLTTIAQVFLYSHFI